MMPAVPGREAPRRPVHVRPAPQGDVGGGIGAEMFTRIDMFRRRVEDCMQQRPVLLAPSEDVGDALERMGAARASCAVVVDRRQHPVGALAGQDVIGKVAARPDAGLAVEHVMTAPVATVRAGDPLYQAVAVMRRRDLSHLPVVDAGGAVTGLLSLQDALVALSGPMMALIEDLTQDESIEGLAKVKRAEIELAESLFDENVPVPEVQSLLAGLNLDIHGHVVRLALAAMAENGWGAPPARFALIVMGSGGRGESFLFPDQDNGMVIAGYDDREHARIDAFFVELAGRVTQALETVGFPLCRGYVMATNPVWRKTLPQWKRQVAYWMGKRALPMLRYSDIFFDFAHAWGDRELSTGLRDYVTEIAARNRGYLKDMYAIQAEHRVALRWGRLATRRDQWNRPGMIDLKYGGTLPLVEGVRLLALLHGIAETSTLERIERLTAAGELDANEQDYLAGGLQHITRLLLRQQIADARAGNEVTNFVAKESLSRREKEYLVACLRAVAGLRGRIGTMFSSDV